MAKRRFENISVNRLEVGREVIVGGDTAVDLRNAATDEKAKVSSNDTTPGFLNGKLVAGTNITLTENNNGGDETLTIAASGGGKPDLIHNPGNYTNSSGTTFTDIATLTGLQPNTYYLVSIGGYFDPQYSAPNSGWQCWKFRVTNGINNGWSYPDFWNGYSQVAKGTALPGNPSVLVNTMLPLHYSLIQGGYGLTWNADSAAHFIGATFSIFTGSDANNLTIKWQGAKNDETVGGNLRGYDCIMIARPINS